MNLIDDDNLNDPIEEILPRIQELTTDEESILEKNIVWVFGVRRSGTTWLRDLLSHDTKFLRESHLTDHLSLNSRSSDFVRLIDEKKDSKNYFFSTYYRNTWQYYLGKLIIYRIFAEVQDYSHKIIVKEPSSYLSASDLISQCTPKSKVIIILRDGRDVIDSIIDGRQKGGWLSKNTDSNISEKIRSPFIEKSSKWWVKQTENLLKTYETLPKERKFLVYYEDLLKNTFDTLQKIYELIEIPISNDTLKEIINKFDFKNIPPEEKGKGKFYRFANPGKWKENFNKKETQIMNEIMGEMLRRADYEL